MAAGRHLEIYKNMNNSWTVHPILITKFGTELRPDTAQTQEVSKPPFCEIQDGRRQKGKFTKNWMTSKRFVIYALNLACIIHFAPGTSLWSQNVEIHNPRWPPAAILKFSKAWITPEPFDRFSSNMARSFVLTTPRHRNYQNRHFAKSKMVADEKLKFIKNE